MKIKDRFEFPLLLDLAPYVEVTILLIQGTEAMLVRTSAPCPAPPHHHPLYRLTRPRTIRTTLVL